MSNVTVSIGGRSYAVACGDGEERHIAMLGETIHEKIAGLPNLSAQPEARTLLYAALLLADELAELRGKQPAPAAEPAADAAPALEELADRLESIASRLEQDASST